VIKAGIEPVWNLPRIAVRLGLTEEKLRDTLKRYTQIPELGDSSKKVFLPQIGGCTLYFFGDPRKLADPKTEVAVRCHDECNGSDVFCTDICTCRPYLLFAIQVRVLVFFLHSRQL
jgi:GTP cyclohydrolase II